MWKKKPFLGKKFYSNVVISISMLININTYYLNKQSNFFFSLQEKTLNFLITTCDIGKYFLISNYADK